MALLATMWNTEELKELVPGWQRPAQQVHGDEWRKVHVQQQPSQTFLHQPWVGDVVRCHLGASSHEGKAFQSRYG